MEARFPRLPRSATPLAMSLWAAACLAPSACEVVESAGEHTAAEAASSTIAVRAQLGSAAALGITSVHFALVCEGGTALDEVVPLVTSEFIWADTGGIVGADWYSTVPPGQCTVTATALDEAGEPLSACAPASVTATVIAQATAEVSVAISCTAQGLAGVAACVTPATACGEASPACVAEPLPAGVTCDDGVACTQGSSCDGEGVCGTPHHRSCNDGVACTADECDPIFGCASVLPEGCEPPPCTQADIDGDGKVNIVDVQCSILVVLWQLQGGSGLAPACLAGTTWVADLDCSGAMTVSDVLLAILRVLGVGVAAELDWNGNGCPDTCDQKECGDGVCTGGEDCSVCPADCGVCLGACCAAHESGGCELTEIQECVCDISPGCCSPSAGWTAACVKLAAQKCGLECLP